MKCLIRLLLPLLAEGLVSGCTTLLVEKQAKPKQAHAQQCPRLYSLTRMEMAGLDWAFSDPGKPADGCLALYYPNADKDPLYQTSYSYLSPLMIMSLPADMVVDTLTMPVNLAVAD
jgi:uncharacterized protein YceK